MGNESGTWNMYGVEWDDPECIHTPEEVYGLMGHVHCHVSWSCVCK